MENASGLSVVTRNASSNGQIKSKNVKKLVPVMSTGKASTKCSKSSDSCVSAAPITDVIPTDQSSSSKVAAGAIETNRYDVTDIIDDYNDGADCCPHCLLQLNGKRQVRCDVCSSSYHQKCTEMTCKVFDKFITSVTEIAWVCSDCKQTARSSFRRLEAAIAQLTEEIAVVKNELSSVKYKLCNIKPATVSLTGQQGSITGIDRRGNSSTSKNNHGDGADDEARTTLIIHRTLNDTARRKRNVIISGLPELDLRDGRAEFIRLCQEYLIVKPSVAENACM
jgi:hypothetical protein